MSLYLPRHIKHRSTRDEVQSRRIWLYRIVNDGKPMSVRQTFYQATVKLILAKTEDSYRIVKTDLGLMRRQRVLPYDWISDNTRWQRKPRTFDSIEDALKATAQLYRKSLWSRADSYVEIWLEKDALSGVVLPVTSLYDVPLMVARGYPSLSFLHSAAEHIRMLDVPAYIYHLGDYDPSGVNAGEKIEQTLREMAPDAAITFERLAVTREQIVAWSLPTRPTKKTDSRARKFGGDLSVELDAIEPHLLRRIVQDAIERHLPPHQLRILQEAEASEREILLSIVTKLSTNLNGGGRGNLGGA